jgi:hypothetical protein
MVYWLLGKSSRYTNFDALIRTRIIEKGRNKIESSKKLKTIILLCYEFLKLSLKEINGIAKFRQRGKTWSYHIYLGLDPLTKKHNEISKGGFKTQ